MEIPVSRRRPVMVLAIAAVLVIATALPAAAAVCQSGGDYSIDCTVPDSTGCDGTNSTVRTTSIPGLGSLELRYDAGCRSIWGRAPQAVGQNVSAQRTSCLSGNTEGLAVTLSSGKVWSRQLNDKNCTGRAKAIYQSNVYLTSSY